MDANELIQKAKKQDPIAFAEIYERYQPCIYRYAFYRLGSIDHAEQLTSDVFAYLAKHIDHLHLQDTQLHLCLLHITEDLLADSEYASPPHLSAEPIIGNPPLDASTAPHLAPQYLARATAQLPPEQQKVIFLTLIEGLDRKEVSQALGKSLDVITNLQIQALASLARMTTEQKKALGPDASQQHEEVKRLLHEGIENLAHELRTPLNLIQGYAELLLNHTLGKLQPEQSEAVEIIYDRTQALAQLTHNLSALRTIPTNALTMADISVTAWIESVVRDFRSQASQTEIQVAVTAPDESLPPVQGDRKYLDTALFQVLDNAVKFSPGKDTVRIRTWADEIYVYVAIEDQGIGIASEHLEQIFERFYQVDGSATRHFGGVGLGLSVVHAVIQAHGGFVQAASEGPGMGSTITIALPIKLKDTTPTTSHAIQSGEIPPPLTSLLSDYLAALEQEKPTTEEYLTRYPEYADDLHPLLDIATRIHHAPRPASSSLAFAAGKKRMLDALQKQRPASKITSPLRYIEGKMSALLKALHTRIIPDLQPTLQPALLIPLLLVTFALGLFAFVWFNGVVYQKAILIESNGIVEIIPSGNQISQIASSGHLINVGDRIRTGPNTTATIRLFDGSITRLEGQTELTIAQMRSRRDGSHKVIILHQWMGETFNHVKQSADTTAHFRIETPTAMAVVQSTEFSVDVKENSTRVMVIKGIVEVTAQKNTIQLKEGQETMATLKNQSLAVHPIATVHPLDVPLNPAAQSPEETPTLRPTPHPTPFPTATLTPTAPRPSSQRSRPTPTQAIKPTIQPRATNTSQPTNTPQPTTIPRPTNTPTPRPTPTPKPTNLPAQATASPSEPTTPTSTPFIPTSTSTTLPTSTSTSMPTPTGEPTNTVPASDSTVTTPPRFTPTPESTTTITSTHS